MADTLRILIVEDDEDHAFLEADILNDELDCEVTVAVSRADLSRINIKEQDIVLLDFNLPDATGSEILSLIRKDTDIPVIIITAQKESFNGSNYTSAKLLTRDKFEQKYGRFEARIRMPEGSGLWPAFWLLGADCDEVAWPICGEIDIMEYRRQEPISVSGSVHGPGYSGETEPQNQITKSYDLGNDRFDAGFHVFGIEWGPDYINYYVDDVLYNQITPADIELDEDYPVIYTLDDGTDVTGDWVFNKPFYIILNLAVGGNFPQAPDSDQVFPQSMLVDYVRVYKNSNN